MLPPVGGDLLRAKESLRRRGQAAREALTALERREKGERIAARVLALEPVRRACTLLLYAAYGSEVPTLELARRLLAQGRRIAFPRILRRPRRLEPVAVASWEELVPGPLGILVPPARPPLSLAEIEAVVVPGLAFDRDGHRLGHGHGYYDRFLAELGDGAFRVGVAFACQVFEAVPSGPQDVGMHTVVTEEGVFWAPGARAPGGPDL